MGRTLDPAELMLRFQNGDEASFQRLTEIHRLTLFEHLRRRIRNPAVTEELVQDVFLRVYRARHDWQPSAKFTT
jgi:RNA polymerase sigma-70 factor (ECF subfamily)